MNVDELLRQIAQGILRFGGFVGGGFLFGLPVIVHAVMRPALREVPVDLREETGRRMASRLEGLVQASLWAAALAALLAVVLQGLLAAELRGGRLGSGVLDAVFDSSAGRWQLARLPLVAALAVILVGRVRSSSLAGDSRTRPVWWSLWFLLATFLLFTNSLAGHAASSSPLVLTLGNDLLHLIAGATWFSGVVVLAVVLPSATTKATPEQRVRVGAPMISRFADVALVSIALVAGTGTFNSLVNVARPSDLVASGYGRVLALKLLVFGGVLALGGVNHFYVRRKLERSAPGDAGATMQKTFRRTIAIELVLAFVLMAFTGALVTSERTRKEANGLRASRPVLAFAERGPRPHQRLPEGAAPKAG